MVDAVIFACWAPRLYRLSPYIVKLKAMFNVDDVYIGINPSSHPQTEMILRGEGFTNILSANPNIELNSDASAYQAALLLFKHCNKKYDNVYFVHTKGMSYASDQQWKVSRESYFDSFLDRREQVKSLLSQPGVGGVGIVGQFDWSLYNSGYVQNMKNFCKFKYSHGIDIMWLTTHYVIRFDIVEYFVKTCSQEFFSNSLKDRYFFEASFPFIVDLCGYRRESCVIWDDNIEENYNKAYQLFNARRSVQ